MAESPGQPPPPIADRTGSVAGIESLTIDGRRYFFGFDYRSDLVVSPLIADAALMAAFASRWMEQADGPQDADYWRELADASVAESELTGDDEDREFSSQEMRRIAAQLAAARRANARQPDLQIGKHALYLLGAASGWPDEALEEAAVAAALERLALDPGDLQWDVVDESIAMLNGEEDLPAAASYADAAAVVESYLRTTVNGAPANWRELFAPLLPPPA